MSSTCRSQILLVRSALLEVVGQWEVIEGVLGETTLKTVKTSLALDLALTPQLSLQTLQGHTHRLKVRGFPPLRIPHNTNVIPPPVYGYMFIYTNLEIYRKLVFLNTAFKGLHLR